MGKRVENDNKNLLKDCFIEIVVTSRKKLRMLKDPSHNRGGSRGVAKFLS